MKAVLKGGCSKGRSDIHGNTSKKQYLRIGLVQCF